MSTQNAKPHTVTEYYEERGCLVNDHVRNALRWARVYSRRDQLSPQLRRQVQQMLIDSTVMAVCEAAAGGPTYAVSAAQRARMERIEGARRYASAAARDAMRSAGFAPEDYEPSRDEWEAYIRDEVRRVLVASGREDLADEIE